MNTFMTLFLSLTCLHLLVDFYFQPATWVKDKNEKKAKSTKLALHSLLHGVLVILCLFFVGVEWTTLIGIFALVTASHWLIDLGKILLGSSAKFFALDQLLHLIVLAIVAVIASKYPIDFDMIKATLLTQNNVAIVFAYLLVLKPVSIFIGLVLQNLPLDQNEKKGIDSVGETIGYVERILMLTFILLGQYVVVGIVLGAKSIFRFGELSKADNLGLTEYVLLGSLLSVTVTSLIGVLLKLVVL